MKTLLIASLLLAPLTFAADQAGRFDAGSTYEAPAAHAPASVSRMFVKAVSRSSSVDVPAAGGSGMIIWTISADARPIAARVTTPSGSVLQPSERGSRERGLRRFNISTAESRELDLPHGAHEVVHVMETVAATYRVDVEVPQDVAGVMVVAAEPDSALTMSTWAAPLSRRPHEPVTLHAELRDGDAPIAGARVVARLAPPNGKAFDAITLTDRGNGIYEATIADLPANVAGAWQVRFDAEGATANGTAFARTGSGQLVAERGAARLHDIRSEISGDVLRVTARAEVYVAGNYRFDVIAAGAAGANGARENLAWAEGARRLEVGETALSIELPLVDAKFFDVRLLGLDQIGVADRVAVEP